MWSSARNVASEAIMSLSEVLELTGVSERTLRDYEKAGEFPRRIKNGPTVIGWPRKEALRSSKAMRLAATSSKVATAWRQRAEARQRLTAAEQVVRSAELDLERARTAIAAAGSVDAEQAAAAARSLATARDALLGDATRDELRAAKVDQEAIDARAVVVRDGARTAAERLPDLERDLQVAKGALSDAALEDRRLEHAFRRELAIEAAKDACAQLAVAREAQVEMYVAAKYADELANPSPSDIRDRRPCIAGQLTNFAIATLINVDDSALGENGITYFVSPSQEQFAAGRREIDARIEAIAASLAAPGEGNGDGGA